MSGAPVLAVRDLVIERGHGGDTFTLAVDTLELRAGEALAVLGPNGAGKSTLLRAMAGLLSPLSGQVVRGPDRDVALVFQRPIAFTGSVAYNVELPLWARGLPRAERRRRGGAALEAFGIGALAGRDATTLSGGELRRLALARAFATEPDVLLLDEPFDDLDASGREALSLDLRRILEETGVAVALVSHDLRQALLLADGIAVLVDGSLAQVGSRDEVLRAPAGPEIAELVGMVNLIPGVGAGSGPGGLSRISLGDRAEVAASARVTQGQRVWVGVRPENAKLGSARGEDVPHLGRATVSSILSDGVLATAVLDWDGIELRTHLVAGRGLGHTLKRGDRVWIDIRPEDVHVLPRA